MILSKKTFDKRLLTLALPFLAMVLMIAVNALNLGGQQGYRLDITGYDPRDLLRGHYVIFRYDWDETLARASCENTQNCCACLNGNPDAPDISFASCETASLPQQCDATIKLGRNLQPDNNLRRYYIPERHAPMLDKMLRANKADFSVELVPTGRHSGQLKMLFVNGEPLPDYLKQYSGQ